MATPPPIPPEPKFVVVNHTNQPIEFCLPVLDEQGNPKPKPGGKGDLRITVLVGASDDRGDKKYAQPQVTIEGASYRALQAMPEVKAMVQEGKLAFFQAPA